MRNRFLILGLSVVVGLAVAIPALAGSSGHAEKSASAKSIAQKALKKAKKANKRLNALPAPPQYAVVATNGTLVRGTTGVSSLKLGGTGLYQVNFPKDISQCAWVATIGNGDATPVATGEISTSLFNTPSSLLIQISNSGGVQGDRPFHAVVHC